jgi:hypothetical protein
VDSAGLGKPPEKRKVDSSILSLTTRSDPTSRAVCLALAAALRKFGVPEEILTDIQDG